MAADALPRLQCQPEQGAPALGSMHGEGHSVKLSDAPRTTANDVRLRVIDEGATLEADAGPSNDNDLQGVARTLAVCAFLFAAIDTGLLSCEAVDASTIAVTSHALVHAHAPEAASHASAAINSDASLLAAVSIPWADILQRASKKALGGGVSGAAAGVAQVFGLMWLRTTMNYQYRYGTGTREALTSLYREGGIGRLYKGLPFALVQTPLARFGDVAANAGMLALLASPELGADTLPVAVRTALASGASSLWRIGLTPIDTLKTTLQVRGDNAYDQLVAKVKAEGPGVLFQGALANAAASFVGSYPWFLMYNTLDERLPPAPEGELTLRLLRSAFAGVCAAAASDCVSNSLRVLKTTRQTSPTTISYVEAAKQVIESDGVAGLFARGLSTRLVTNMLQAIMFSVVWKYVESVINL